MIADWLKVFRLSICLCSCQHVLTGHNSDTKLEERKVSILLWCYAYVVVVFAMTSWAHKVLLCLCFNFCFAATENVTGLKIEHSLLIVNRVVYFNFIWAVCSGVSWPLSNKTTSNQGTETQASYRSWKTRLNLQGWKVMEKQYVWQKDI